MLKVAEKKKTITDIDIEALIADQIYQPKETYKLQDVQVVSGTLGLPTATVRIIDSTDNLVEQATIGTGPVDACFSAIDEIIKIPNELTEYNVNSVTEGIDAIGEVTVRIKIDITKIEATKRISAHRDQIQYQYFSGHGANTDIFVASARAYVNAINQAIETLGLETNNTTKKLV